MKQWTITPQEILQTGPIVPVMVIEDLAHAVPLSQALVRGGIRVLEITLRTDCALDAIRIVVEEVPDALVGAGTVLNGDQYRQVVDGGGKFAISPGFTEALVRAAQNGPIPIIPGVATPSEIMAGMELGLEVFKFFPAEINGGAKALKAVSSPLGDLLFCPTGGVKPNNAAEYLALPQVPCVGGSWVCPKDLVSRGDWEAIEELAREAVKLGE